MLVGVFDLFHFPSLADVLVHFLIILFENLCLFSASLTYQLFLSPRLSHFHSFERAGEARTWDLARGRSESEMPLQQRPRWGRKPLRFTRARLAHCRAGLSGSRGYVLMAMLQLWELECLLLFFKSIRFTEV